MTLELAPSTRNASHREIARLDGSLFKIGFIVGRFEELDEMAQYGDHYAISDDAIEAIPNPFAESERKLKKMPIASTVTRSHRHDRELSRASFYC